ncbi:hypothetical protein B0H16DRAFT_1522503 [Mycena metata]|uniref:Uncharacterized protein n=1 Tax=Mycena metata TaxID=1033252 RepID=A0AAD7NLZ5_9AGAR|nr:hypothetical protein B0H16DRAFT_1522503 [Mycena metata]
MSSSTTETTTYILEKYSRAYSPKKASGSSEWQHFTNPVLRLILDTGKSEFAPSMRLRIVWTMNGGGSAAQDVILEDLDLIAFSALKTDNTDGSSPLKGVYRDTTFGLRYLYAPESTEGQKVYRRFQVSFNTPSVALQLVDAIRDVCPCKTNEPSAGAGANRKIVAAAQPLTRADTLQTNFNSTTTALQRMPTMILDPPASSPLLPLPFSSQPQPQPTPSPLPDSSPPPPSSSAEADSVMMPPPPLPLPPSSTPTFTPTSSGASAATANANVPMESLAAALCAPSGLYDNLSGAALERLVGDVVREDGFVGLLESLSSMWALKAVAG